MANYAGGGTPAVPRFISGTLTSPGWPRVNVASAHESMTVGIRGEKGGGKITADATGLFNRTKHAYVYKFDYDLVVAESDFPFWLNLLCQSREPIDAYFQDADQRWWNFFLDASTDPTAPTAPGRLSLVGTKHVNSSKLRNTQIKLSNLMDQAHLEYLFNNHTVVAGGSATTGGYTLTAVTPGRSNIKPYGYWKATFNDNVLPKHIDIERTWEIDGTKDADMGQNSCREMMTTVKLTTYGGDDATLKAIATHANTDAAFVLYSRAGETETYNSGGLRMVPEISLVTDDYGVTTLTLEGSFVFPSDFRITPSFIDFTTPTAPVFSA